MRKQLLHASDCATSVNRARRLTSKGRSEGLQQARDRKNGRGGLVNAQSTLPDAAPEPLRWVARVETDEQSGGAALKQQLAV